MPHAVPSVQHHPESYLPSTPPNPMPAQIAPGLIAIHSNRLEALADTVAAWLAKNPLEPLEQDIVLVQSNGMAEWFKMMLARRLGVCAAVKVELPGRFIWRTYRQVLGGTKVPRHSPLDKTPLAWRLMRLLPTCLDRPGFEPLAHFLKPGEPIRLWQLASSLADLFDQYQVYRADWLGDWAAGFDRVKGVTGVGTPLPPDQRWQADLWRCILAELQDDTTLARPQLHQQVVQVLGQPGDLASPVARRVVVFGFTHLPVATLELLWAMGGRTQVLLALPNPCRFHWGDIMAGRELYPSVQRYRPLRSGVDTALVPLEDLHAHAHPLLAAWGRQGRDFVRQLDQFDDRLQAIGQAPVQRVDMFDEEVPPGASQLVQLQCHVRDLLPLAEHPKVALADADRSVVFHVAHSAIRELEVLHDQLLLLLGNRTQAQPLEPRDVVVMVPTIDTMASAIQAVFGQYKPTDKRYIPFDIADVSARVSSPLVTALEWLLQLPTQRCRLSELRDLLDQPAVARRFGIPPEGVAQVIAWAQGAGVRWGLNASHRADLGLGDCGDQNSAWFGLHRMLMGYAVGDTQGGVPTHPPFANIEPYAEVGGLGAVWAGGFALLLGHLVQWQQRARCDMNPGDWSQHLRQLLADTFLPESDADRRVVAALNAALTQWQEACSQAGFEGTLALTVVREAWLSLLEEPALQKRFRAGGVTFCTMMPMRAIPFDMVCLLGMNEADYPRRSHRSDFDLMGLPGQFRPGDRSRRDDDRQLMLDAVLSARRTLYISWTGRDVRDNSARPPSVLVAQLRDYLEAAWGQEALSCRTTEHPLQPFSRRYFEQGTSLVTFAHEWRSAHHADDADDAAGAWVPSAALGGSGLAPQTAKQPEQASTLSLAQLTRFYSNPVRAYFRDQLGVVFDPIDEAVQDDECFELSGLNRYATVSLLIERLSLPTDGAGSAEQPLVDRLTGQLERLVREGVLPMGGLGRLAVQQLGEGVLPMLTQRDVWINRGPALSPHVDVQWAVGQVRLEDRLSPLWQGPALQGADSASSTAAAPSAPVLVRLDPRVLQANADKQVLHWNRLIPACWVAIAAAACQQPVQVVVIGLDCTVVIAPWPMALAQSLLTTCLEVWQDGQQWPLPLPIKTALAVAQDHPNAAAFYEGGFMQSGESQEMCWARVFPDFAALQGDDKFMPYINRLYQPLLEQAQLCVSVYPYGAATEQPQDEAL